MELQVKSPPGTSSPSPAKNGLKFRAWTQIQIQIKVSTRLVIDTSGYNILVLN